MPYEYWNDESQNTTPEPPERGLWKSLVTLLALVLALAIYMLPAGERLWPVVFLAIGGVVIWLAYGAWPRLRAGSRQRGLARRLRE